MSSAATQPLALPFDVMRVRQDFPILAREVHGQPLAYLDNGASAQRPLAVIAAVDDYERHHHANIHRGVHTLSQEATALYEGARDRVMRHINARSRNEVLFVRGTTEAINLVAQSYARPLLKAGDEILITHLEHHANIVPWQMVCEQTGAKLVVAPMDAHGEVHAEAVEALMGPRTRLLACAHVSNALGTVLPVRRLLASARARGIVTLLDGAQAIPHMDVDMQSLACDFYVFSGHKVYAPTGIGVLYGREALLERMPPWQGGGDMILTVSFEKSTYNELPSKFEAGTPNISGAIGLAAAMDYMESLGIDAIAAHENHLVQLATAELEKIPGIQLIGTAPNKASIVSFILDGVHPHDLGTILDHEGVAVRTGHHCAMPLMTFLGLPATVRASFAVYNTEKDVASLVAALGKAREVFG
jgi:cysteine desulfurase/selenocysteine lyase